NTFSPSAEEFFRGRHYSICNGIGLPLLRRSLPFANPKRWRGQSSGGRFFERLSEILARLFVQQLPIRVFAFVMSDVNQTKQHVHRYQHDESQPRSESTRLNSSHVAISYAVFCLKKKKKQQIKRDTIT